VIRVDGRSFTRFTSTKFEKPFDMRFRDAMVNAVQALVKEMHGIYAYTESDEISVLFRSDWTLFDRELEKIISISASLASSAFTLAIGEAVQFDSWVWVGINRSLVVDYFRWRQADAARCALNGWCYWTLRKTGESITKATSMLEHASVAFKNELLFQHGINFNELPLWQRRGIGLYWETFAKEGYDPIKKERVTASRRRIKADLELPMKDEYSRFMRHLMKAD
jgi:tRNA(His) guanylyltransferase